MTLGHNLVLTGFMGTGKTTVGRELALRLGMEFIDTDELIEARHGSIASIFAEQGEARFRELESGVARELGERRGLVIATGGRMVLDPGNSRELSRDGRIFCLVATPEEVHDRIATTAPMPARPLLEVEDPRQRIVELMAERQPQYRRFPQVATGHRDPGQIADEIEQLWLGPAGYQVAAPGGGYTVTVGAGILPFVRQLASISGPLVVVADEVAADLYQDSLGDVDMAVILSSDQQGKIIDSVQAVDGRLISAGVDETATVVVLGSSTIGDIAGYASASYMGGLDLVRCPTDLSAMVESVGGQVGWDLPEEPALFGRYRQPKAVVADVGTLQALSQRDFASGMAEVIKHGLVASSLLLDRIESWSWVDGERLMPGTLTHLQSLLAEAIQVKIAILGDDPSEEDGRRAMLDLGHSFAHGIEDVSERGIDHGEAVAIGLVAAARLSHLLGHAGVDLVERVEKVVEHVGLQPVLPTAIDIDAIVEVMHHAVNGRGSRPRFVLMRGVGDLFSTDDVTPSEVKTVLEAIRARGAPHPGS